MSSPRVLRQGVPVVTGEPADLDALERAAHAALQRERVVYLHPELHDALRRILPRVLSELRERRERDARMVTPGGST